MSHDQSVTYKTIVSGNEISVVDLPTVASSVSLTSELTVAKQNTQ